MDRIVIKGIGVFDGEYPLDLEEQWFNAAELHIVKRMAGVRQGEMEEALAAADNDILVSFAVIAVRRSGKFQKHQLAQFEDMLWEADSRSIDFIVDAKEEDVSPPASRPESEPASSSGDNEKPTSSGVSSDDASESQETDPSPTGPRLSEISAA